MKFTFIPLLLIPVMVSGQSFPADSTGKIIYREVVSCSSNTETMNKSVAGWFQNTFKSVPVPVAGSYNSTALFRAATGGLLKYDVTIDLKDGRYRYTFTNFVHILESCQDCPLETEKGCCRNSFGGQKAWITLKEETARAVEKQITDLKQTMNNPEQW